MFGGGYILMGVWMLLMLRRVDRQRPPSVAPPPAPETEEALQARFEEFRVRAAKKPGSLQPEVDLTGLSPEMARHVRDMRTVLSRLTAEQQAALALADEVTAAAAPSGPATETLRWWPLSMIGAGILPFLLPAGPLRWLGMALGTVLIVALPRVMIRRDRLEDRRKQQVWADASFRLTPLVSDRETILNALRRLESAAHEIPTEHGQYVEQFWRGYREALEKRLAADPSDGRSDRSG